MNPKENYLHEFFRIFFANKQLVKRVFLIFAVIALLLPLVLKQSFDITAQVIVQSKKLSQGDATTSLTVDNATFIPPSLADMETESNILRSPALIRQTISELRDKGEYNPPVGVFAKLVSEPFRRYVTSPLRQYLINPLRNMLGLQTDPVRDTVLDGLTQDAINSLKIETLPGSNVISIVYSFPIRIRARRSSPLCCRTIWAAVRRCNRSTCRNPSTKPRSTCIRCVSTGWKVIGKRCWKVLHRPIRRKKSPSA